MAQIKLQNVEDYYEIGEVLGSGHFGQVRAVLERASGVHWAGKFLKLRRSASSRLGLEKKSVETEVEILQSLQHANVMALKDVFESRAEVVLIVELISGGELFDFIAEKESLSEEEAIEFLKQILMGVGFMHTKNIAHFDLKPENIMLADKTIPHPHIKIIDFGLAHRFKQGEEYRSLSGTPQYISPEVINYEPLSEAADIWSIGVITYILERMTADECLVHPWIKPLTRKQADNRSRSSINMKSFKKFNAKRKWKMSYNMVWACNRLFRLQLQCKSRSQEDPELRQCESDQEDTETKPASLIRRRLSSSS
ncbi:death-associated protein kinase 2-like isoform X2 [Salvelinus alpinus]|uniref:death-associated protein kinase 2-like isoform X2 n=1 Tax=Salvelinus alpinus TaxID=8036 RepID=UPI0039FC0880